MRAHRWAPAAGWAPCSGPRKRQKRARAGPAVGSLTDDGDGQQLGARRKRPEAHARTAASWWVVGCIRYKILAEEAKARTNFLFFKKNTKTGHARIRNAWSGFGQDWYHPETFTAATCQYKSE